MRQVLATIAAVLVLAGAVGGAYWWLDQQRPGAREEIDEGAAETAEAYLAAWAEGDHSAMVDLLRTTPSGFVAVHEQLREGLGVDRLRTVLDDVEEVGDGRALALGTVRADVPQIGEVTWPVRLHLLRERGRWGIAWEQDGLHPEWAPGLQFAILHEDVGRELLLAHDGEVLAGPGERVTFGFEPGAVRDRETLVTAFESAVPGTGDTVRRILGRGRLVDHWFYPVVSLPVDEARVAAAAGLSGVPGVLRRTESGTRTLLADNFAVHLVGRVAEATAEQLEQLGEPYVRGDHVGQSGLEAALERRLAAGERVTLALRDGSRGPIRAVLATARVSEHGIDPDVPAGPVTTTLDVLVQRAVENVLLDREAPAAIVVVDGADGAVRASASRPVAGFDRAIAGRYPPGGAFLPVVAEAAAVAGTSREQVDVDALTAAAGRLGFGAADRLPLTTFGGSFPTVLDGDLPGARNGQAQVEASPLHLASVAAATVSGAWHPPYLLLEDGPGEARQLGPGGLDAARSALGDATPATAGEVGIRGIAATSRGVGGVTHAWFLGTVDGLGFVVLLETGGSADEATDLAVRFVGELRALAEAPTDLDPT